MKTVLAVLSLASAFCLAGCAGYHLGDAKPNALKGIQTIAVGTFKNITLHPRVEALVTNTVIKQLQQDGTYRITSEANADAVLEGAVLSVGRTPARSVRGNVLATNEFNLGVTVTYTLRKKDGTVLAGPGTVLGTSSFFVGSDVITDERQALPLATEDLAVRLVSQLSEGW